MLIRFRVSNFLSFKEEVEFSMVAGKVQQHSDQVIKRMASRGVDLLRVALIYGANAAGKSNLVSALAFTRCMITHGVRAKNNIPVKPFLLDKDYRNKPSKFEFEIKVNEKIFEYGFVLDRKNVYQEWLVEIKSTTEKILFKREMSKEETTTYEFYLPIDKEENARLQNVGFSTPSNRLFLQQSVESNISYFTDIYDWFDKSLIIIYPSTYHSLSPIWSGNDNEFSHNLVDYLESFDTGVHGYTIQNISNPYSELPKGFTEAGLEEKHPVVGIGPNNQRYFVKKEDDKITASKLLLNHQTSEQGTSIPFEMENESDGTLRLLDLIPTLFPSKKRDRVVVIDELDRSLHPSLSYEFISLFIEKTMNKQMIVTTHESNLLDLDLVRRDEIWFVEKNVEGSSKIYSLEEFSPRYDKDIRKGYIMGRFGAIPLIGQAKFLGD